MILYSKRTAIYTSDIHPRIVYIYWDFDKCVGGHLDKDRKAIPFYSPNVIFNNVDHFHTWRNKFKEYWEEPTNYFPEDYLQVDEGL